MKIIIIASDLFLGGSQRYLTELSNYWAKMGHEVTILVLRKGEIFYSLSNKIKIVKFYYHYSGKLSKISSSIKTMIKLRNNVKQNKPDFVLSNLSTTNILTIFSTSFLGTKVFIRDAFSHTRKRNFLERISRKYFYKKAAGIIAQTQEIKNFTKKITGSENIKVIRNPVREFKINKDVEREKIIINVGALISRKGQKYFIEACSKIDDPDWKFVILGEGNNRCQLEKQINELNLQDRIELVGAVKNVDEWLLKSSIFVFSSMLEGLPNALIEAMASGLPSVSFDCDTGPRDLINDNKNGFLIPVGDVDLMVLKIKELINNTELRNKFSIEAIKSTDKFKVKNIAEEVLDFCTGT